jgi:hypothetical protein
VVELLRGDLLDIPLSRFVKPHAAAIPKDHAAALIHLRHLLPIIQIGPTRVGHPVHLSGDGTVTPPQHRVAVVLDLDEAINDPVVSFGALQQVMGAAVASE